MSAESRVMGLDINRRSMFAALGLAGVTTTASGLLLATPAHALTPTEVQRSLWGLYYYSGAIDGALGAVSKTAIRAFQTDRKLVVDGVPGSITQAEISRVVRQIQAKRGLVQDANYGSVTVASIKKFQASKGLVQDGRSGPKTMSLLGVVRVIVAKVVPGKLVAINQFYTGAQSKDNCGPTSCVVALVAIGRPPTGYVSSPTGNRAPVERMRTATGVAVGPTDLRQLQTALRKYGARTEYLGSDIDGYEKGIQRARNGETVILNLTHGRLLGTSGKQYGHYVVARGTDSSGRILVSDSAHWDPVNGSRGAVVPYTVTQLRNARHVTATFRRALVVKA